VRALLLGDIHLSDRAPSSCTESYNEDMFTLLEHSVDLAQEHRADIVVWAGDVFHHKQPSRTSHKTVQRTIEIAKAYPHLVIVPGNHDMLNDRLESISLTQPLGVLEKAGIELLNGWMQDWPVYGIPWQQEWSQEALRAALEGWNATPDPEPLAYSLVVTHAPLYPPGKELPYEYFPTEVWAEEQGAGYVYYGHVHDYHGTYQVGDVTFCNQGALTRGSLHESELTRELALTLWDNDGFERIEIPHKPADQVFRLLEKRELQDTQARLDEFLASIGEVRVQVTSIEAVLEQIRALKLGTELEGLAEELLQGAQHGDG